MRVTRPSPPLPRPGPYPALPANRSTSAPARVPTGPAARVPTAPAPTAPARPGDARRPGPPSWDERRGGLLGGREPYRALPGASRAAIGLPNLRRNVCPHFYVTGPRGAIPIQAPHLLKAVIRQDSAVSRCQLRGGVHLEQGYVNDVCLTPRFNQCVFYEDELTRD